MATTNNKRLVQVYLFFNGKCEAAFRFYEKVLGGKIDFMMTYGESPEAAKMPAEMKKNIIHARMSVGDKTLMGSDAPPERFGCPARFSQLMPRPRGPEHSPCLPQLAGCNLGS